MANEIKNKPTARQTITIGTDWTIEGLASSTTRVGRQSDMIDNSSNQYALIEVSVKVRLGSTPTGNRCVYVHLIRGNGTERDDGAGASDAALTQKNAPLLGTMRTGSSPSTGDYLYGTFLIHNPGREWGLMLWHDTVAALDSDAADHTAGWVGMLPEIQ